MNPWLELNRQPAVLEPWQLLLLLLFLLGYAGSIGRLLGGRGRLRAALLAVASGALLCVLMSPWVLGPLMVAAAVAAVGLFTGVVMLLSRLLGVSGRAVDASVPVAAADAAAPIRPAAARAADPVAVG